MAGVPFILQAFENGTLVGSSSVTGAIPSGFVFPEGFISFNSAVFNRVVLSVAAAPDFAIDNVNVGVAAGVPEPGTLSLMLLGIAGAFAGSWRRRKLR